MSITTTTNRYVPDRNEWSTPCEHEKCETLHRNERRFRWLTNIDGNRIVAGKISGRGCHSWHDVERFDWYILDTTTGDRAVGYGLSDVFDTKRAALAAIAYATKEQTA